MPALRAAIAAHQRAATGSSSTRPRGAGHLGRDRGDRRRAARLVRAGRRGAWRSSRTTTPTPPVHRDGRRAPRGRSTLRPPGLPARRDDAARPRHDRTRVLLLNTPAQPDRPRASTATSSSASPRLPSSTTCVAVTDEVYEHLVFDGEHVPLATLPGMAERTLTISSAGKTFSFTGWKIGWASGPAELVARRARRPSSS